jgi:DNA-directed RNA polymerase specialized sigma24 family protein
MKVHSRVPLSLVVGSTPRQVSDAELAKGLAEGEAWAVTEAWHRFAPMVMVTAERALGSTSEAEDLAQEIRALKSQLRYKRLRAWLSFHGPETLVDLRHSSLDIESRELLAKFYALLDRLSARDRLVFVLRRVEGLTVEEIATTMDVSRSTVKRSMAHASSRLARWVSSDPSLAALGGTLLEGPA